MAEKKGVGHAYNVDFLNVVFAATSLFLLLSVVWMVWDDYDRDWKNTQRRFNQLELQVTRAQLEQAGRAVERNKLQQLEAQQKAVEKNIAANKQKVDELTAKAKDADLKIFRATLDVNFIRVAKMDRCQTCHLAIDKKGYEKYPQPFTTHPDLNTYLGGSSTHPIDKVGCTVCHEGMGQSISFRDAAHMPSNEKQKEEWEKKYHWEEPHLWDYPMLPLKMTEASCAKCHKQQVFVPKADALTVAYATYERAGCYACHKTRGFETVRKPGPILTKIDF